MASDERELTLDDCKRLVFGCDYCDAEEVAIQVYLVEGDRITWTGSPKRVVLDLVAEAEKWTKFYNELLDAVRQDGIGPAVESLAQRRLESWLTRRESDSSVVDQPKADPSP